MSDNLYLDLSVYLYNLFGKTISFLLGTFIHFFLYRISPALELVKSDALNIHKNSMEFHANFMKLFPVQAVAILAYACV